LVANGGFKPFSTERRMSRIEQIDGRLKGVIDPKRPFAIDQLNGSCAEETPIRCTRTNHSFQQQGTNPIADERIASFFDAKEKMAIVCDSVSQRSIITPNEKPKANIHD